MIKSPEGPVNGTVGDTVFVEAEFRNNTHWPYKPGTQLLSFETSGSHVIEQVKMPVQQIMGMTNFTLIIPVKIKDGVTPGEYELMFGLIGPRGWPFGESLTAKLKVLPKIDEMEIFKRVKALIDNNLESKFSFEETLKAFKAVGYDEQKAIEQIKKQRQEKAKKFAETACNQSMFKDDEHDDDLYS